MACPAHLSWAFKMMASMSVVSALSKISGFVILSCHRMPRIEHRLLIWKRSSGLICLLSKVQASQPYIEGHECDCLVHLQLD